MEGMTVKDWIELLKQYPEDYKVTMEIRDYNSNDDYGDGWHSYSADEYPTVNENKEEKSITLEMYGY